MRLAHPNRPVKLDMGSRGVAAHLSEPLDATKMLDYRGFLNRRHKTNEKPDENASSKS